MKVASLYLLFLPVSFAVAEERKPYAVLETVHKYEDRFLYAEPYTIRRDQKSPGSSNEPITNSPIVQARATRIVDALRADDYEAFLAAAASHTDGSLCTHFTLGHFNEMVEILETYIIHPIRIMNGRLYQSKRANPKTRYSMWIFLSCEQFGEGLISGGINLGFDYQTHVLKSVFLRPDDGYRSFHLPDPDPTLEKDPVRDVIAVR
ncbi:MAG: hypothetical protein AAGH89_03380 [Verrucomicrobiota bacterium]